MKSALAPKHVSRIGNSAILWFEANNQYVIISNSLETLFEAYFASATEEDFIKLLHGNLNISRQQAEVYHSEITESLITSNSIPDPKIIKSEILLIPEKNIKMTYNFGQKTIAINYGSEKIKDLIHPQWIHAVIPKSNTTTCSFHIFKDKDILYLLKDHAYVGHYPISDYHLLQGQFAVELINIFYDKEESDWIATFHASTVCNDKEAIMIIGDSGNGKSTLSAVLMANGIDVLCDDFTPLSAVNKKVYRFPSGISVKEGAFEILDTIYPDFEDFPMYSSSSKRVKVKYIPPIKNFATAISNVPCKKIVYVNYDAQRESEIKEVSTEQILSTLIPESWLSPLASNSKLFLNWLKDLQCYELNYSDNTFAISQFNRLFDS